MTQSNEEVRILRAVLRMLSDRISEESENILEESIYEYHTRMIEIQHKMLTKECEANFVEFFENNIDKHLRKGFKNQLRFWNDIELYHNACLQIGVNTGLNEWIEKVKQAIHQRVALDLL